MGKDRPRKESGTPTKPARTAPTGSGAGSPTDALPELAGRLILVYTRTRPLHQPVALTDCYFEWQGGRVFLVGTSRSSHRDAPEWCEGIRRCVAWDAIDEYLVFSSLAEYHNRNDGPPGL
jgi:hypothetical protein